jgi:hypothetical protein
MEAVLVEFKARVAKAKADYKTKSKEEKKELRTLRKATNQYVEKVTHEWRVEKTEEKKQEKQAIRDSLAEWAGLVIDVWDTRNPPSNIFQMEAACDLPYSQKKWLHA